MKVIPATKTVITAETPFAPLIAAAGASAPPAAMSGANACHYLNVTGNEKRLERMTNRSIATRSLRGASKAFLEDVKPGVQDVARNIQRGNVPHRRVAARKQNQPVLVRVLLDRVSAFRIRLLRMPVRDELRRLHHPEAAAVSDELISFGHFIQPLREVLPDLRAPGPEALVLDHIERCQRRGARYRVPAERVRTPPAFFEVHLRGIHRGTNRQPAAQGLSHRQDVRDGLRVFDRPHLSGPAEA